MNHGRWLDDSRDPIEVQLRHALDDAQNRVVDEVALRRVWGKVSYGEPERRPLRWQWFVGGVASSAALVVVLILTQVDRRDRNLAEPVVAAAARATTGTPTPPAVTPSAQPKVAAPATVRTAAGETLRLALRGGVEASVGSRSVLSLGGRQRPSLESGDVSFKVPRQPPGESFSVDAGPYRVVVLGTKFRLRHEGRRVAVEVQEGTVEIWRGRRLARLTAGESWAATQREPRVRAKTAPAKTAPVKSPPGKYPQSKAFSMAATSPWSSVATPPETQLEVPLQTLIQSAPAPSPRLAPAPPLDPAAEARAALASGDVQRALSLYRTVLQRGGPAAENAEYEIATILRDRLRQPVKAIAAWRRYRAEHPDGLLRVETDVSIIETLVRTGENDAALTEAQDFLGRHPNSERRAEIAGVAGDLHSAAGNCRRAVKAYEMALAGPRSKRVADHVTFHRAACLMTLHDDGGPAALRAYLRDFANGRFRTQALRMLPRVDDGTP